MIRTQQAIDLDTRIASLRAEIDRTPAGVARNVLITRHNLAVQQYNTIVTDQHNQGVRAHNAKIAEARAARVQSQSCGRCFTIHAGEC